MGVSTTKIKNCGIVIVSTAAGLLGLELGALGGEAVYNDVRFVIGKAPHVVCREGKVFKKYVAINPYNGSKTRVVVDKKSGSVVAAKRQPKGYTYAAKIRL